MRRRFGLLLKKRGRRRAAAPGRGWLGEFVYHTLFVAAGVVGGWWLVTDVLLPEWRLAQEAEGFTQTEGRIVGARVADRPGLAEPEYCPELCVEYTAEGQPTARVWTRHGVGRDTPSREEALDALERYRIGERCPCWYDPAATQRVVLSVRRRWWPWLVLSIPATFVIAGVLGLVRAMLSRGVTAERRSVLRYGAIDAASLDGGAPRPLVASGLPRAEPPGENPGVRRAYRLASDASDGWRVAGAAALSVVWNALAALFALQFASGRLSLLGRVGLVLAVVGPLAAIGVGLTLSVWREARSFGGGVRLELDRHPLRVGDSAAATLLLSGGGRMRSLAAFLVLEEIVTYRQGTDARTATHEAKRVPLLSERGVTPPDAAPLERELTIELPSGAPHSFVSPNNELRWSIEVTATPAGRPAWRRRFPLVVVPAEAEPGPERESRALAAEASA